MLCMSKKSQSAEYIPKPIFGDLAVIFANDAQYTLPDYAAPSVASIDAQNDLDIVVRFLRSYKENKLTAAAYRSELERFLHWSWHRQKASILDHDDDAITSYIRFFKSPNSRWIGTSTVPRFISDDETIKPNPEWRPFVAKLSKVLIAAKMDEQTEEAKRLGISVKEMPKITAKKSDYKPAPATVAASIRVLSSLYEDLALRKLVPMNYVKLIKQKKKLIGAASKPKTIRRISEDQWKFVIATARQMADDNKKHERTLFIMSILYLNYLRISELVADDLSEPKMSDFYQKPDGTWWLFITGKGTKNREVPVSDELLRALTRYRKSRGLSPYPSTAESEPLLIVERLRLTEDGDIDPDQSLRSTRAVRQVVQQCFDKTYERMLKTNGSTDKSKSDAASLREATVHWLRHTGISEDVKERDIHHVREDAGHSKIVTTSNYVDIGDSDRHKSAKNKKLDSV